MKAHLQVEAAFLGLNVLQPIAPQHNFIHRNLMIVKKPSSQLLIVFALSALCLIGGLVVFHSSPTSPASAEVASTGVPPSTPLAMRVGSAADRQAPMSPSKPIVQPNLVPDTSSMAEKFDRATSLRAFFYQAIRAPQSGGYFYGTAALGTCTKYSGAAPIPANASPARLNAIRLMTLRCEMTDEDRW